MFLLSQLRISDLPGVEAAALSPAEAALSCCVMVTQSKANRLIGGCSVRLRFVITFVAAQQSDPGDDQDGADTAEPPMDRELFAKEKVPEDSLKN